MVDEEASLEAPSSGRSEEKKSRLEQYEDSLRYKLWCLNLSQGLIDIFSSLVKTLPIALAVNVIALIITADERTIRLAGTIIFTVLLVVWLASLATFLWLMLRCPKIERHVEMGRKLVERHTNQTEDAFRDYKQTYVPPVGDEIFMGSMLDDNGRVGNHVRKRTWRSKWAISPEIQNDMTYWNGPLVDDIDKLDVDAGVFYNFLDFFSERCSPPPDKMGSATQGHIRVQIHQFGNRSAL